MKRLSLLLVLLASVLVVNAWHRRCDEAIVIVATKHLTPDAKKMVKKYLGKSYADDVQYLYDTQRELTKQKKLPKGARNIHDLHLDKDFKPKSMKYDAYNATVEALEVIRNRKSHTANEVTEALRIVINLMCDMHHLSKVRLEGYPHSYKNFEYTIPMREWGPKAELTKTFKWRNAWKGYDGGFNFFFEMMGFIGINLGVVNLLPVPALDGSRIVFAIFEWIFKKPVNRKVEGVIHTVGLLLLLGFSILVDVLQIF